jgi:pyruvate ferredoxin oxidoreductase delta subunit
MGRLFAVEIVYRGIFQKTLAKNISRAIVLAAHKEGKPGISFGRYGDSPERNGIPAKAFAIVATDDMTLEEGMAKYEPQEVDVSICVDDTLFKGVESWAWYGLQPINKLVKPGGTLIVTSLEEPKILADMAHAKKTPYQLAIIKGTPSFSGLWVYKEDHTDVRILGAIAKALPELFSLASVQETIRDEWQDELKATSAQRSYERLQSYTVKPGQGNPEEPYKFDMPKWTEMREGIAIPGIARGHAMTDPISGKQGGYQPERNATFKKWATRTMRPVVDFDKCIKCTLCWLACPDSLLRLRGVRGGLPRAPVHHHGQRDLVPGQRGPVGRVEEGPRRVREVGEGKDRRPAGALPRFPLPRAVRGAGPRNARDRPAGLRQRENRHG